MCKVLGMKKKLITIQKAAHILGVNPETLRRWDRKDQFKAKRHPINGYRIYDVESVRILLKRIQKGVTNENSSD